MEQALEEPVDMVLALEDMVHLNPSFTTFQFKFITLHLAELVVTAPALEVPVDTESANHQSSEIFKTITHFMHWLNGLYYQ